MGLFTGTKEYGLQLYFRDDQKFQFIKRELTYSCLVERAGDQLKRAWKHFFGCQLPFPGYRNIPAGMVTLGCSRDIILDPFDKIPKGDNPNEKPNLGVKDSLKKWISKIAESQRHTYRSKRKSMTTTNRITWALISIDMIMIIVWAIRFATKG